MRSLLSVADLSGDDLDFVLARAQALRAGSCPRVVSPSRLLGLIFFEPSLRTRVGFAAAAARLGWRTVETFEPRHSPTSVAESWPDTLRTVAGYADVIVARPGRPLGDSDVAAAHPCQLVNGGDVGPEAEHPSQALIDVFAMEQIAGPLETLDVAIVGDLRMRAVRSLLGLLDRRLPASVLLIADEEHLREVRLPGRLAPRTRTGSWDDARRCTVVYVAGIPHGALPLDHRAALLATAERVGTLASNCVLLSPMPVIDEMDPEVKGSDRNRMYVQSDLGLYVRMALLERIVGDRQSGSVPDVPQV